MIFALICDGMGGMKNGAAASRFVVDNMIEWSKHRSDTSLQSYCDAFRQKLAETEKELIAKYPDSGTTLVAVIGINGKWRSIHLGDSRCYYKIDDEYKRTTDHAPVDQMYANGMIDEKDINDHPMKNIISGFVGHGTSEQDLTFTDLGDLKTAVLCTDGAYGCMNDSSFRNLIDSNDAQTIASECLRHGSRDNISVIKISKVT